MKQFY